MNTCELNIRTSHDFPPIPDRQFDWSAWIDGREEWLTGRGPTEEAAIADLREQMGENSCELCGDLFPRCECQSVIADCCTCGTPIFGREDYARGLHWRTKADTYTCELCVAERREEQQRQDEWRNTWSAA